MRRTPTANRIEIVEFAPPHGEQILAYYQANKAHLEPWEPARSLDFYTLNYWQHRLTGYLDHAHDPDTQTGAHLGYIALHKKDAQIVGIVNLSNISLGVFRACNLGYSVGQDYLNQGFATELVGAVVDFAFDTVQLHRVSANYMPHNAASARVLEKLGFEKEGLAKSYLKIDGQWQDHILTARINPQD